jgi:AraC family transcriptional regulator of adaptative response / DNA-3-methyladenine glycosylase II
MDSLVRTDVTPTRPHAEDSTVDLDFRPPLDAGWLIDFFARRAVPGVEAVVDGVYRRGVRLEHGGGVVELRERDGRVEGRLYLDDERDHDEAVARARALFDLDLDPRPVIEALQDDPLIGASVRAAPGRRVPGVADPNELAIRAVLGQQVSLAGAATLAGRLVADCGEPLVRPVGAVTHLFPTAERIAALDPDRLAMPASRRRAVLGLAAALASARVVLDPDGDQAAIRTELLALPGIGPWTVEYIAMRALRDPDAFMATDLGVRHALERMGVDGSPRAALAHAERWRPYRSYALQHVWAVLG